MTNRTATAPEPQNPDYAAVVQASFARQGLLRTFGATLSDLSPGRAVLNVPYTDAVNQQQGFFHGAVMGAIADSAGGYASLSLMAAGSEVVTVEYKINFLKPAIGQVLVATGEVLRAGRSITVAHVDLTVAGEGDAAPALVGVLQGTFMRVAHA